MIVEIIVALVILSLPILWFIGFLAENKKWNDSRPVTPPPTEQDLINLMIALKGAQPNMHEKELMRLTAEKAKRDYDNRLSQIRK